MTLADLQSNISISATNAVTGDIEWCSGYTQFSTDIGEQAGWYLALQVTPDVEDATVTAAYNGTIRELDNNIFIIRLADGEDTITFTAEKEGYTTSRLTLDISGLNKETITNYCYVTSLTNGVTVTPLQFGESKTLSGVVPYDTTTSSNHFTLKYRTFIPIPAGSQIFVSHFGTELGASTFSTVTPQEGEPYSEATVDITITQDILDSQSPGLSTLIIPDTGEVLDRFYCSLGVENLTLAQPYKIRYIGPTGLTYNPSGLQGDGTTVILGGTISASTVYRNTQVVINQPAPTGKTWRLYWTKNYTATTPQWYSLSSISGSTTSAETAFITFPNHSQQKVAFQLRDENGRAVTTVYYDGTNCTYNNTTTSFAMTTLTTPINNALTYTIEDISTVTFPGQAAYSTGTKTYNYTATGKLLDTQSITYPTDWISTYRLVTKDTADQVITTYTAMPGGWNNNYYYFIIYVDSTTKNAFNNLGDASNNYITLNGVKYLLVAYNKNVFATDKTLTLKTYDTTYGKVQTHIIDLSGVTFDPPISPAENFVNNGSVITLNNTDVLYKDAASTGTDTFQAGYYITNSTTNSSGSSYSGTSSAPYTVNVTANPLATDTWTTGFVITGGTNGNTPVLEASTTGTLSDWSAKMASDNKTVTITYHGAITTYASAKVYYSTTGGGTRHVLLTINPVT